MQRRVVPHTEHDFFEALAGLVLAQTVETQVSGLDILLLVAVFDLYPSQNMI